MIEEILIKLIWVINSALIGLIVGTLLLNFLEYLAEEPKVKCPYCKNKQRDSTYRKQVCDRCNKEWFDAYDD